MDRKLNDWQTSTRLNDIGYKGANVEFPPCSVAMAQHGINWNNFCCLPLNMGQFRLAVLLLVSMAAHALGQVKEPEYGGKTISEWLLTSLQQNGESKEM